MYIAGFAGCQFCLLVTSETAARWKKINRSRFRPNRNARPHRHNNVIEAAQRKTPAVQAAPGLSRRDITGRD
jgi:hypothetical protein